MKTEEELNKHFEEKLEKQSWEIQWDVRQLLERSNSAYVRMQNKLVYGKPIPDDVLDDLKEYRECFCAALKLIEADVKLWNDLEKQTLNEWKKNILGV